MSTIDPSVSVEISEMVKKTGAEFVDAPVEMCIRDRLESQTNMEFTYPQ